MSLLAKPGFGPFGLDPLVQDKFGFAQSIPRSAEARSL